MPSDRPALCNSSDGQVNCLGGKEGDQGGFYVLGARFESNRLAAKCENAVTVATKLRNIACPPTMSTHKDLSSLPPAVLRAALEASEKRVERERDNITKEMCQLQKRLDELEKGPDIPKREEPEKPAASESKGVKRRRVGSSSDESVEVVDVEEWYDRQWPIAKARKLGEGSRR